MKFLIAYDIFDNKRRRKVAEFLYQYSHSYQKSALEVDVSKNELKKIYNYISKFCENEDKLYIFKIEDSLYLGKNKEVEFII